MQAQPELYLILNWRKEINRYIEERTNLKQGIITRFGLDYVTIRIKIFDFYFETT